MSEAPTPTPTPTLAPTPAPAPAPTTPAASPLALVAAFAAVYLIWGSTYLGIRIAIETIPPFLMGGSRFVTAGLILYAAMRGCGAPAPSWRQWRNTTIIGAGLLLGGNGSVVWAEQRLPSAIAALVVATVPVSMVLLDWAFVSRQRPTALITLGLACGLGGMALLVGPLDSSTNVDGLGALVIMGGTVTWAAGSLFARRADLPRSPFLATAMEMLTGGTLQLLVSAGSGEWTRVDATAISAESIGAWAYLTVAGSLVAFSAYIWLLRVTRPAYASTYAFVNPVVALILGAAVANESLTPRSLVAAAIIITGVVFIITSRRPEPQPKRESLATAEGEAAPQRD